MKVAFVLGCIFACAAITFGTPLDDIVQLTHLSPEEVEGCMEMSHLTSENLMELESLKKKDISSEDAKEVVTNFGCFMACLNEKTGLMIDNKIQSEPVKKTLGEETNETAEAINDVVDKCVLEVDGIEDKCEVAISFMTCTLQKFHEE